MTEKRNNEEGVQNGILVVFTGDGKGKTLASLGCALRASGYDMKTLIIQFMKGDGQSGEMKACEALFPNVEIHSFGIGFLYEGDDREPHREMVRKAWRFMERRLKKEQYDILVLDELSVVLDLDLFPVEKVITFFSERDANLHVIVTGRNAPPAIIEAADVVTEMREVKHIYHEGVPAIIGLDY